MVETSPWDLEGQAFIVIEEDAVDFENEDGDEKESSPLIGEEQPCSSHS